MSQSRRVSALGADAHFTNVPKQTERINMKINSRTGRPVNVVDITKCKGFKPEVLSQLDQPEVWQRDLSVVLEYVIAHSDFDDVYDGATWQDFPLDARACEFIEDALDRLRPHVLKWRGDGSGRIDRILRGGVPTSNPKHVEAFEQWVGALGSLYGLIAAHCLDGRMKVSKNNTLTVEANCACGDLSPRTKVLKYLRYGAEDGLLNLIRYAKQSDSIKKLIDATTDKVKAEFAARGEPWPANVRVQSWLAECDSCNPDASVSIERLVFINTDTEEPFAETYVHDMSVEPDKSDEELIEHYGQDAIDKVLSGMLDEHCQPAQIAPEHRLAMFRAVIKIIEQQHGPLH